MTMKGLDQWTQVKKKKKKGLKLHALEQGWIAENGKSTEDSKCRVGKN